MSGGPITDRGKTQFSSASEVIAARRKNVIVSYYNNNQSSQKSVPGSLYTSFKGGATNVYGSPINVSGYVPSTAIGYYQSNALLPPTTAFAPWNYVTISMSPASGTITTSGTFTSTQVGNSLTTTQVYSSTGYVSNVYCSTQYKGVTGFEYGYFGLSRNPSAAINGATIDFGFVFNGDADVRVVELSLSKTTTRSWTSNDVFKITYDGTNVNYFCNVTNIRSVSAAPGTPLYLNAIPFTAGNQFVNLTLGTFASSTITVNVSYTYTNNFVQSGVLGEKQTPNMNVKSRADMNNPQ
jgi:hypothetical protein